MGSCMAMEFNRVEGSIPLISTWLDSNMGEPLGLLSGFVEHWLGGTSR